MDGMHPDEPSGDERGDPGRSDWILPAVVVAIASVIALVVILVIALSTDSQPPTLASELESWTRCLRSEGADVPLVEALGDGGVRITIDGSILEGDVAPAALVPALRACRDDAPGDVTDLLDQLLAPFADRSASGVRSGG